MLGPQDTQPEEIEKDSPQKETSTAMSPTMPDDIDRLTIARALRIENLDEMKGHQRRFDNILNWAHEKGARTEVELLGELTRLRNKLGMPTIYDINVYVSLELEKMALAKKSLDVESKMSKFHKI